MLKERPIDKVSVAALRGITLAQEIETNDQYNFSEWRVIFFVPVECRDSLNIHRA